MEEARPPFGATALRRLLRKRLAMVCLVVILVIYLAGILAPLVAPYGYNNQELDNAFAGPSLAHPLGTDRLGRDMLSRVIWASQTTVIISAAAIFTGGLVLGVGLGLLGGSLFVETLFGIPGIGQFTWKAVFNSDYDVIMAVTLITATAFIVANLVTDIVYGFVDPRVRFGGGGPRY